jgi:hypothetical protein
MRSRQPLSPTSDLADDELGIGGPDQRPGIVAVLPDIPFDGSLEIDHRVEHAALQPPPVSRENKVSTPFNQEDEVGVNTKCECRSSPRSNFMPHPAISLYTRLSCP